VQTLGLFQALAPVMPIDLVKDSFLSTTLALCNDPIPNIRFNAAKALEAIVPGVAAQAPAVAEEKIRPMLGKMVQDADQEVRYYAGRAVAVGPPSWSKQ
jgi:serine/threonine-protein phosphatase 2A regulatory subunit A